MLTDPGRNSAALKKRAGSSGRSGNAYAPRFAVMAQKTHARKGADVRGAFFMFPGDGRGIADSIARSEESGKTAFFPRNDRPYGVKREAFQTENALNRSGERMGPGKGNRPCGRAGGPTEAAGRARQATQKPYGHRRFPSPPGSVLQLAPAIAGRSPCRRADWSGCWS